MVSATAPGAEPADTTALRAWAEIDLDALAHNVGVLREAAPNAELMAVVKADAYGHGLVPVAAAARAAGASWLGVALPEEALELRAAGDTGPLLCWLAAPSSDFAGCIAADIDVSAYGKPMLAEIAAAARTSGRSARVHLKVDTGLSRGGAMPPWEEFFFAAAELAAEGLIDVVGLWSHLAYADEPTHPTIDAQVAAFEAAAEAALAADLDPPLRHLANSAATLRLPHTHYDLVRPGIAMYGITPGEAVGTEEELGLRPVMTLKSRLVSVKSVPAGTGVSYAHAYHTAEDTEVALVPMGYADGIPRAGSNLLPVRIGAATLPVAGRVCMDQFVVDLHGNPATAGDVAVLFGDPRRGDPTATQWAQVSGTIGYEIVTRIGPRVPRVIVHSGPRQEA